MWHKYPYTNFHDLNLDWLLGLVKDLEKSVLELSVKVDDGIKYMKDNLYANAQTIINQFIDDGTLFVAVTYTEETERLDIVTSQEGE